MSASRMNISQMYKHLYMVISHKRFLKREGLGKEIPFFICPYHPKDSVDMQKMIENLEKKLNQSGVRVLSINLYDFSIMLLKERGIWYQILEDESQYPKDQLKELLQNVLDPQSHLIPAIAKRIQDIEYDVLFLSGVGEVFPYIRSHSVLNNLQSTAKEQPTVMFFPGDFVQSLDSGASLDLFNRLHDDKYYRAFNIFHYEVLKKE